MDDRESVPESGEQKAASDAPVVTPNAATPPLKTEVVPVKVQDTNVPLHCFAVALRQRISQEQSKPYRLAGRLLLQVGVPLSLAIIATIYAAPTMTAQIDVFFGDLVKLASLGIVAVHTILAMTDIQGRGISTRYYMIISIYLLVVAVLVGGHALAIFLVERQPTLEQIARLAPNQQSIHKIIYNEYAEIFIAFFSSLYLLFFYLANRYIRNQHKNDIGITRFTEAFMYGANLPFLVGCGVIFLIFLLPQARSALGWHQDSFLVGSITFLVFSSMAASICIDMYARPFLEKEVSPTLRENCYANRV